jgi:hypothetical protein
MKTYSNLTKENFWNELTTKCPRAMEHFCAWIDEYKASHNWKKLFNEKVIEAPVNGFDPIYLKAPKFHDLPIEMQLGILMRYFNEQNDTRLTHGLLFSNPALSVRYAFHYLELNRIIEETKVVDEGIR